MDEVLRLNNIVKTFPGVLALDDMNFDLNKGEIHAICGENGAGKSTLMKIVTGVYKPDSGEILIDGEPVVFEDPNDAFAKGIAIIYQETSLFEEMTILENIFLGHEYMKKAGPIPVIDYAKMRSEALEIFKIMNVDLDLNERTKNLGMAQKQMVEIAKALSHHSKILILDEPTASLTQREVEALFSIVRSLRDQGVAIAYISHRLEEIFELCDRVTVVRDGRYISTKLVAATNKDELVADMVGRSMDNYYPKADVTIGGELIRVEHLSQEGILSDVNFHIDKGEIVGFAGLAGAGRTELALALCGFTKIDGGKIYVEGKEVKIHDYRDAMNAGFVYVSEDRGKYGLVIEMSVKQNITMPQLHNMRSGLFLDNAKELKLAGQFIGEFDIKCPDADFLTENLSGGNQQKVSVSKAIAMAPKILFLDEPTRGVDVGSKAEIHGIVSALAKKGTTIFMISSEMPELIGMCDRIYIMKNGTIAGEMNRAEATQEKILKVALQVD
ncbi:MAG: sugar ABC transporter ATP-binding protein [Clostridiales Family XIII bacterium]|jgi:ABC-type sugar transport system ATPase subunit|nr:sugar ABC transporter ATP-binding protein [Clostridiales Family XIII bacterium]